MRDAGGRAVVVCDDIEQPPAPLETATLLRALREELPGAAVREVPGLCSAPGELAGVLAGLGADTAVVVGCRGAPRVRAELLGAARRAGLSPHSIEVVDLRAAKGAGSSDVLAQSLAVMAAAWWRLDAADTTAPARERASLAVSSLSRRGLWRGLELARRPVAAFRPGLCDGGEACAACVAACPRGALRRARGGVTVDEAVCDGCGACVPACRNCAFSLPGADIDGLEAAAGRLISALGRGVAAAGVAVTCQRATEAPLLGGGWLCLPVPSLEMVSAGWLLQLLAAGVSARVVACDAQPCAARARQLDDFLESFSGAHPSLFASAAVTSRREGRPVPCLREPTATSAALSALGVLEPEISQWRVENPGAGPGVVTVDPHRCSLCGVCARSCPTAALVAEHSGDGLRRLSFDALSCTSCGVCVTLCPEAATALERVLDSDELRGRRRVVVSGAVRRCRLCGVQLEAPLPAAALTQLPVAQRLVQVEDEPLCADCRLRGRCAPGPRGG